MIYRGRVTFTGYISGGIDWMEEWVSWVRGDRCGRVERESLRCLGGYEEMVF